MENKLVEVELILSVIDEKLKDNEKWIHSGSHYRQGVIDGLKWIREQLTN